MTLLTSAEKQQLILDYGLRYGRRILVETGTFLGDTVEVARHWFHQVHSVELSPALYDRACERFSEADNVTLYCGDSGDLLPSILAAVDGPALFWVDAHYSGGITAGEYQREPLYDELRAIFASQAKAVVLIDDARGLNVSETLGLVSSLTSAHMCEVEDDIVRITPR